MTVRDRLVPLPSVMAAVPVIRLDVQLARRMTCG